MKEIIIANRQEQKRLNDLIRLALKAGADSITYNADHEIIINNKIVKKNDFDNLLFYDLHCACGFNHSNEKQFTTIKLCCDGVLYDFLIAYNITSLIITFI